MSADPQEASVRRSIVIPYTPREHFRPLHRSTKRFRLTVAHRRAGKSVAQLNEMIKKALQNNRRVPPPRYAYVGPSFSQTKDLIWGYVKQYTSTIPGVSYSETDLRCTLPNGATITLYGGAAAYERMRGLYFDGIVLDEFSMLNPSVFSTVVRPCLADYLGWAIVSGTSNGDDHFHELKKRADKDPHWEVFTIPVTETDALHPDEVEEMRKDMSPEEFAREMMCSFDAPVEGSYYADLINIAYAQNRVCDVPWRSEGLVITWWDIGVDDYTAIWLLQIAGKSIGFIDYIEGTGKGIDHYVKLLKGQHEDPTQGISSAHRQQYMYGAHVFPPDVQVREWGNQAKTRLETAMDLLGPDCLVSPAHRIEDGINSVRSILPISYWDKVRCDDGLSAIKNYHKNPKTGRPDHNWASHGADAKRIGAVAMNLVTGYVRSPNVVSLGYGRKLKKRIRGYFN